MNKPKERSTSVETFSDELKNAIREGLPPVKANALVDRARELVGEGDSNGEAQQTP